MKIIEVNGMTRKSIAVELTPQDQDVIYSLCQTAGGAPEGPRGVADKMRMLLQAQGAVNLPRSTSNRNFFMDLW